MAAGSIRSGAYPSQTNDVDRQCTFTRSALRLLALGRAMLAETLALARLGFVSVEMGAGRANMFRLVEDWRALDASEAKRLEKLAREAKAQRRSCKP